ncbi:hypothetical protein Curi_c27680 [Gottschalkia acidurici 9a]|uniref:DUF2975 domain-containing protein n=1 Tax=Gottschalkia acidurici (strain ATCC 7906 / DSM 604 / BCRC 14475 / CIP 104303 / KCTC 5404 / NCIMB 10678 / 9a) TaxID=1128398 RepID=K0B5E4_GOTA9|nr:DUF2975 domain-containing protein [Gottschalkia acidurici]AFS79761.1 hypothetical protein Curi_c27680 [Gottschalkia acidurici 9a]
MKLDNKKMINFMMFILNLILTLGVIITFSIYYNIFNSDLKNLTQYDIIIMLFILTLGIACTFLIALNLRKILKTLLGGNPFLWENVKLLNRISIECFIITGCYIINILLNLKKHSYKFLYVSNSIIHTDTEPLIFFLAGIFILILSVVFKQAIIYKEDSDNTI